MAKIMATYNWQVDEWMDGWEKCNSKDCYSHQQPKTLSLALTIQTIIAHALDEDNIAIMASLDLSSAFDMVNIDLLLRRMKINN